MSRTVLCIMLSLPRLASAATAWDGPVAVGAVTDSVKWTVRAVPDGAGGMICAWEENRGRKVCCRDTRDLYAQRLDASGSRVWDVRDVPLAVQEAGEELLGLVPEPGGGALVFLRRGHGSLVAQAISPSGSLLHGPHGSNLDAVEGMGEWIPVQGCATADNATALLYGLPVEGGISVRLVKATRSMNGWQIPDPVEIDRAMGLHPGAIAWCGTRWIVVTWSETADGLKITGRWVDRGGASPPFDLGTERGRTYAYLQSTGDGKGGAWIVRSAVHAAEYSRTHTATVTSVSSVAGKTVVRHAAAGFAKTSAMFIPPVMVGANEQGSAAATPPTVAWRPTSWIVPAGKGAACMLRVLDGRLLACVARRAAGRLSLSASVPVASGLSDAFSPVAWERPGGGVGVVWGVIHDGGVRLESAVIGCGASIAVTDRMTVAQAKSPRVGAVVLASDGTMTLAWAESLGPESGAIRAIRLPGSVK